MLYLTNLTDAVEYFTSKYGGKIIHAINGNLGVVCYVVEGKKKTPLGTEIDIRYYITFKRDFFNMFGREFNLKNEGKGQTINMKILERAFSDKAMITIIMPTGKVYDLEASTWLQYAERNNTIRIPSTETGREASVPARMLRERFNTET